LGDFDWLPFFRAWVDDGGKVMGHREVKVALLEVTTVDENYSVARVIAKTEGATLAKELKVKQVEDK